MVLTKGRFMPDFRRRALIRNGIVIPLCVAALLRFLITVLVPPQLAPLSDSNYYDATAQSLAEGYGYSAQLTPAGFLPGGDPTSFFLPGYSHVLSIAYAVLGYHPYIASVLNTIS